MSSIYNLNTFNSTSLMTLEDFSAPKTHKSMFESLIEFDDEMCLAELYHVRNYYGSLLESTPYVLHEGVIDSIIDFIKKVIENIFKFFKSIFGGNKNSSNNGFGSGKSIKEKQEESANSQKALKDKRKDFDKKSKDYKKTDKVIRYGYPEKIMNLDKILSKDQLDRVKQVEKAAADLTSSASISRPDNYTKIAEDAAKVAKQVSSDISNDDFQNKNFSLDTSKEEDIASFCKEKYKELIDGPKSKLPDVKIDDVAENDPIIKSFNDAYKKLSSSLSSLKKNEDDKDYSKAITAGEKLAKAMAALYKSLASAFTRFNSKIISWYEMDIAYLNARVDQVIGNTSDEEDEDAVEESFYLTRFEDVMLAEQANYNYTYYDLIKEGMIKEALIMGNPDPSIDKIYEMQMLNEAIASKAKSAFETLLNAIKKAFNTFMEKLNYNFTTTKHYLDKYKETILTKRIPEGPYQSKDFINGMYRIIKFEIPSMQYNTIQRNLASPYQFFGYIRDKYLGNSVPNNAPAVTDGDRNETLKQIGEYFKVYFGCAGNDVTYNTDYVQNCVKDMYDFCYDIRKIERSVKNSINEMDKLRQNALKQAGVQKTSNPTPDGVTDAQNPPTTNAGAKPTGTPAAAPNTTPVGQESYFSYINNLDYLLELRNLNNNGGGNNQNNQNAPANMTGRVADSMNNFTNNTAKDTNGKPVYGVQGSPVDQVDADCQVYASVCKKILEAKLTAIEFARSEIMQLFRSIVAMYVQGESIDSPRAQNTSRINKTQR